MIHYAIKPQRYCLDSALSMVLAAWVRKNPEKFYDLLSKHDPRPYKMAEVDFEVRDTDTVYLLAESDSKDALLVWIENIKYELSNIEGLVQCIVGPQQG